MKSNRIEVYSRLSPEQCAARLEAITETGWPLSLSRSILRESKPLLGRVTRSKLRLLRRDTRTNGFQTYFYGELRPESQGTIISGKFGTHPVLRLFTIVWLAAVVISCLLVLLVSAIELIDSTSKGQEVLECVATAVLVPLVLSFFGNFERMRARDDAQFIKARIIQAINGREADQGR